MDFQAVVKRRRMIRSFDDAPIPAEAVERILANAQRGPSAGFAQGFEFLVLNGPDETGRYWDASLPPGERENFWWSGLLRAPLLIVAFAHPTTYIGRYAEPDKAQDASAWRVPWWHIDTAFASLLMLLTAVDAGLGALFFAVFRPDPVRAAFGVPEEYEPLGVIAVGYPAEGERQSRSLGRGHRPAAEVMHRGRW